MTRASGSQREIRRNCERPRKSQGPFPCRENLVRRLLLLSAFAILASEATAFGTKSAARNPDTELAGRVRGALHASFGTTAEDIGVTAQNGFVFLYGEVISEPLRARAERIAARVPGVRAVNNELQIPSGD